MIIGFDAKRAFHNVTGLGNYSRTLIQTLVQSYPENEYHLFTPPFKPAGFSEEILQHSSITLHSPDRFVEQKWPFLWRSLTMQSDINKAGIQIYHGLSNELPQKVPENCKTVVTIHDLIHERFPQFYPYVDRKIYSYKFKRACTQADVIVAISEQTKNDIINFYNINSSKIQVIYQSCAESFGLSITQEYLHFVASKYNLPEEFVLYVGTINERKNLLTLIRAVQKMEAKDQVHIVAIGKGGKYLRHVKDYIKQHHLESIVSIIAGIPNDELPAIYRLAKVFVLPSLFEGFGIPIIEALKSGTPVIASTGTCFEEAGGPHSVYVDPNDSEALKNAILTVWHDKQLRERMRLSGYDFVKKFETKPIAQQWITLYNSLI